MIYLMGLLAGQPVVLDDGRAVLAVEAVQPFELRTGYTYHWISTQPTLTEGTMLLLRVDPAWLVPSDTRSPVLYVGDTPAEPVAGGWPSDHLVVVVPGRPDLRQVPVYMGGTELPERVTPQDGAATLALARRQGVRPLDVPAARPTLTLADDRAMVREAEGLLR